MNYLYHMVGDFRGEELMPLHRLKDKYPQVYKKEIKKYVGREGILKLKVPHLNCLWNDVLHFTSVHPLKIKKALRKSGIRSFKKWRFFKINPKLLEKDKTMVFLFPENRKKRYLPEAFVPLKISNLSKYAKINKRTLGYYKKEIKNKRRPLLYYLIPHILYKGILNKKDLEIIEV